LSSDEWATVIIVPLNVQARFTKQEIELGVRVMFWTHPPEGFVVVDDPTIDWSDDFMSASKYVRARGKVVSCN
jgi:hypothetical protein